ncbi:L-aspartate oxidase [Ktedonobacter racemifer]|uniref:L-aspartate oxidase n=1 Tax=Ktedonobacter racemifer DSM 44963 TaxID=485913 RepID=D6TIL5_KTERA|nr:L-aspartate oxidase [Ktedonobacter racemifer]EFH89272.1 L-aspartate oxidase [Ktedonobacter racemifer DSM 44963]
MPILDGQPFAVAIIGGGIAGLSLALRLPETMPVALLTKGQLGESNTRYAQGGLAVALGQDDSSELHFQDTMAAGAGLCDAEAVRILVEQGPGAVRWLMQQGVEFDRAQPGSDAYTTPDGFLLGREGAHCRWRVLHAGGDATGAEIERALMKAVRQRPSVTVFEETFVEELLVEDERCVGLRASKRDGTSLAIFAQATVLASGGAGGLWLHTSNPSGATADGLSLAWRVGAALVDLEFMQFHPTVLVVNGTSHLITEAVRGEGAYLRNHAGERFMPRYSAQEELAPRDVVARAILKEMLLEETDCQFLDLRHLPAEKMHARFPTISAFCREHGLDLARDLLPIAPAAHYCMGGVMVDTWGRTSVPALYAVGEVSCTGVHGANRLASNSLLEGLVYGLRIADVLASGQQSHAQPDPQSTLRASSSLNVYVETSPIDIQSLGLAHDISATQVRSELRQLMWQYASLSRSHDGLELAKGRIRVLRLLVASKLETEGPSPWREVHNMLQVAELVMVAAQARCESRGSHWRLDYQATEERLQQRHFAWQRQAVGVESITQVVQEGSCPHA